MTFFFYLLRHSEERFRSCNILFYQHHVLCLRLYLSVAVIHLCHQKRAPTETLGESPPQPKSMEPPGLKYEHIQGIFIYFYTFLHQNFAACLCDEAPPELPDGSGADPEHLTQRVVVVVVCLRCSPLLVVCRRSHRLRAGV